MVGVCVHRPLLSVRKEAIYDLAHAYGVPYFKVGGGGWVGGWVGWVGGWRGWVVGVCVHRPLLSVRKEAIYELAHTYGVPYFKVTHPPTHPPTHQSITYSSAFEPP